MLAAGTVLLLSATTALATIPVIIVPGKAVAVHAMITGEASHQRSGDDFLLF